MSPAQHKLYFRLWNDVRQILRRQGLSPTIADAQRHRLHREALGYDRSSKDLTNAEFDKVKAHFLSLTRPDDMDAQLDAIQQPRRRQFYALDAVLRKLGKPRAYAEGTARHMNSQGRLGSSDLEKLTREDFNKVLAALSAQAGREKKRSGIKGQGSDLTPATCPLTPAGDPDWTV